RPGTAWARSTLTFRRASVKSFADGPVGRIKVSDSDGADATRESGSRPAQNSANAVTDEELIRRTLAGEESAFAELVRRYQRRIAVTVRSTVGDISSDDLADIVQDIFLLIYRSLGSFRGEAKFGTYITRIALRHSYRES